MNYEYRKDNRTEEKFKKDIEFRTHKQQQLIQAFEKEMIFRGHKILIVDTGIDNSGELIKSFADATADYLIVIDDKPKAIEVQACKLENKITFKTHNLKQYIKQQCYILLFLNAYNEEPIIDDRTLWALIKPEKIKSLLQDQWNQRFQRKNFFGNKEVIQIRNNEFHKYFESNKLLHLKDN